MDLVTVAVVAGLIFFGYCLGVGKSNSSNDNKTE